MADRQRRLWMGLAPLITVSLVLLAACTSGVTIPEKGVVSPIQSSSSEGPINGLVQTSNGGGVTISVEWQGLKNGALVFGVVMDTHSGSLDQINLKDLAVLRDGNGEEFRQASWDAPSGGHHRKGILAFSVGNLNLQTAKYIELVLRDTAGVKERDFKWQLG